MAERSQEETASLWPEDTVEYLIYCSAARKLKDQDDALSKLALECNHASRRLSGDHVWHFAAFALRPEIAASPPHLMGRTCFRDSVQDEWFIVELLMSLSQQYEDFVISLQDGDGQFLLIEAAHYLERWMRPEAVKNRVFLHRGQVHVIPKPRSPAEIGLLPVDTPTITEAVELVRSDAVSTVACPEVQQCIWSRIASYQDVTYLHRTHCYLPSLAAHVLAQDCQLVSATCHALLDRSPADIQACRHMDVFSPKRHAMVTSEVTFTRLLYAQLLHERFSSPPRAGFELPEGQSSKFKVYDLGMKLTCGLEILYQQVKRRSSEDHTKPEHHPKWPAFLTKLKKSDYFLSELEGSKLYQEKMATAKEYFVRQVWHEEEGSEDSDYYSDPLASAGVKIVEILHEDTLSEETLKEKEAHLPPPDDDSWMNITEQDLESLLQQAAPPTGTRPPHPPSGDPPLYADSAGPTPASPEGASSADLQSMAYGIKSFIEKVSSHTGVEFPWSGNDPSNTAAVNFDPDSFLDKIQAMLVTDTNTNTVDSDEEDQLGDSDEVSSSEESERGGEGGVEEREEMQEVMDQMNLELASTAVAGSFAKVEASGLPSSDDNDNTTSDPEAVQPVDVDFNLVKNLLDSLSSQQGMPGPGSNILQSLGISIPKQSDS